MGRRLANTANMYGIAVGVEIICQNIRDHRVKNAMDDIRAINHSYGGLVVRDSRVGKQEKGNNPGRIKKV